MAVTRREFLATAAWIVPASEPGQFVVTIDEVEATVRLTKHPDPDDQRKAWDDALAEAASRGLPLELEPGERYVARPARNGDALRDIQAAFDFPLGIDNVLVRTKGSPGIGDPAQAVLGMPAWEDQRGVRWQAVTKLAGVGQSLRSVRIDGNKLSAGTTQASRDSWLSSSIDYSKGGNGGLHGIALRGCADASLVDVETFDCLTDGIEVDHGDDGIPVLRFYADRCSFHHNRRQGLSTKGFGEAGGGLSQLLFRHCSFNDTGNDDRGMVGQHPGFGIDLEPNGPSGVTFGGAFLDCEAHNNRGATFSNGKPSGQSPGRSLCVENHAVHTDLQIIRFLATGNSGCVKINTRGQDIVRLRIEGLVARNNGEGNRLHFAWAGGRLIDAKLVDIDVSEILFQDNLEATGHSVEVWRGTHNPKITSKVKVVRTFAGMP